LQQYSKYIPQFFRALPYLHSKVVNLDKAIQHYTREVKHIELSKVGHSWHLKTCYLQKNGVETGPTLAKRKRSISQTDDLTRLATSGTTGSAIAMPPNAVTATCVPSAMEIPQGQNV